MATGVLVRKSDRGFGFVRGEDGRDVFAHVTDLLDERDEERFEVGVRLTYHVEDTAKGLRAVRVRVCPEGPGEPVDRKTAAAGRDN